MVAAEDDPRHQPLSLFSPPTWVACYSSVGGSGSSGRGDRVDGGGGGGWGQHGGSGMVVEMVMVEVEVVAMWWLHAMVVLGVAVAVVIAYLFVN